MSATGGSLSGQVTPTGGRSMTGEDAAEPEAAAVVRPPCGTCIHPHRTHGEGRCTATYSDTGGVCDCQGYSDTGWKPAIDAYFAEALRDS